MKTKKQSFLFTCDVAVVINERTVHNEYNFSRWATSKKHFSSLIKHHMEIKMNKKLQWDMIQVRNVSQGIEINGVVSPNKFILLSSLHGSFTKKNPAR